MTTGRGGRLDRGGGGRHRLPAEGGLSALFGALPALSKDARRSPDDFQRPRVVLRALRKTLGALERLSAVSEKLSAVSKRLSAVSERLSALSERLLVFCGGLAGATFARSPAGGDVGSEGGASIGRGKVGSPAGRLVPGCTASGCRPSGATGSS